MVATRLVYFASNLTANIIEGDLRRALRKTRMKKQISKLREHVIVCGAGTTGKHVMDELIAARAEDEFLQEAGLENARGVVAALANDKDNLYLVVTSRRANPSCSGRRWSSSSTRCYSFSPSADFCLQAGMTLVVLGPIDEVGALRKRVTP